MTTTTFRSALGEDMASYLKLKRSVGFKAQNIEKIVRRFDSFLVHRFPDARDNQVIFIESVQ